MASVSVSGWGTEAIGGHGRGLPVKKSGVSDINIVDIVCGGGKLGVGEVFMSLVNNSKAIQSMPLDNLDLDLLSLRKSRTD